MPGDGLLPLLVPGGPLVVHGDDPNVSLRAHLPGFWCPPGRRCRPRDSPECATTISSPSGGRTKKNC
jgi:hypothetical protein